MKIRFEAPWLLINSLHVRDQSSEERGSAGLMIWTWEWPVVPTEKAGGGSSENECHIPPQWP